jgi:hypothetical protein
MRAEVTLSEDTTCLQVRWEIVPEGAERRRLAALGGPLALRLEAREFVDRDGKHHERTTVEVPIWPHPGLRNFGQARFTDFEARRAFVEALQGCVTGAVAEFLADARPGSLTAEGKVIEATGRRSLATR